MQGTLEAGDRLSLTPLGREVRVRGLQVFGEKRQSVGGGSRVAANLAGVDTAEMRRGAVLASPQFASAASFEVTFSPSAAALALLRRRTPVRVYAGAAEILGTLVFETIPVRDRTACGAAAPARRRSLTIPGGAFVLRRLSPKDLLGGGSFGAPRRCRAGRRRRTRRERDPSSPARRRLRRHGARTRGRRSQRARRTRRRSCSSNCALEGAAVRLSRPSAYVAAEHLETLYGRVRERLEASQSRGALAHGNDGAGPVARARRPRSGPACACLTHSPRTGA